MLLIINLSPRCGASHYNTKRVRSRRQKRPCKAEETRYSIELGLALQDCLQSQAIQEEEHHEVMKYITNPANMSKLWKKLIPDEDPANDLCDWKSFCWSAILLCWWKEAEVWGLGWIPSCDKPLCFWEPRIWCDWTGCVIFWTFCSEAVTPCCWIMWLELWCNCEFKIIDCGPAIFCWCWISETSRCWPRGCWNDGKTFCWGIDHCRCSEASCCCLSCWFCWNIVLFDGCENDDCWYCGDADGGWEYRFWEVCDVTCFCRWWGWRLWMSGWMANLLLIFWTLSFRIWSWNSCCCNWYISFWSEDWLPGTSLWKSGDIFGCIFCSTKLLPTKYWENCAIAFVSELWPTSFTIEVWPRPVTEKNRLNQ